MPFQVTDEALDALEQAPEAERLKFFGGLSGSDRQAIADALPVWRQRKSPAPLKSGLHPGPRVQGAPSLLTRAQDALTSGINTLQANSKYAAQQIPGLIGGGAGLLTARAYEGINPFVPPGAVEETPAAQAGALALEESVGPAGSAVLQFAAQQAPNLGMIGLTSKAARGKELAQGVAVKAQPILQAIKAALPLTAKAGAKSAAANLVEGAAQTALSRPEGQRASAFVEGLTDPAMMGISVLTGLSGVLAPGELALRAQRAKLRLDKKAVPALGKELLSAEETVRPSELTQPSVAVIGEGPDGRPVGVIAELGRQDKVARVPLDTPDGMASFDRARRDAPLIVDAPRQMPRSTDLDSPRALSPDEMVLTQNANGVFQGETNPGAVNLRPDWGLPKPGDAVRLLDGTEGTYVRETQHGDAVVAIAPQIQEVQRLIANAPPRAQVERPIGPAGSGPVLEPRPTLKGKAKGQFDVEGEQIGPRERTAGAKPKNVVVSKDQLVRQIADVREQIARRDAEAALARGEVPGRMEPTLVKEGETTLPQVGRDPRSGAVGPPGGGAGGKQFKAGEKVYVDLGPGAPGKRYRVVEVVQPISGGKTSVRAGEGAAAFTIPNSKLIKQSALNEVTDWLPPRETVPLPAEGDVPPHLVEEFKTIADIARYQGRQPGMLEKIYRGLVPAGLRGAPHIAQRIQGIEAARNLAPVMGNYQGALKRAIQGSVADRLTGRSSKLLGAFDKDLEQVALGNKSTQELASAHPDVWRRVKEVFEPMRKKRDFNERRLEELGMLPEKVDDALEEQYLARLYYASQLPPGEWAKRASGMVSSINPKKSVLDVGIEFLTKQNKARGKLFTDAEVANQVSNLLMSREPLSSLRSSDKNGPLAPFRHLRRRQDLPRELRELLGEIHSGTYRMAVSLGIQDSLVALGEAFQAIAADRRLFSPGPQPGFREVPNAPNYGKLTGGYLHPDVWEAVVNAPETVQRAPAMLRSIMGNWKTNLVALGGLGPWAREVFQNLGYSVLAGGLDITRPMASGQSFIEAFRALRAFGKSPAAKGLSALAFEARKLGAIDAGFGHAEIQDAHRKMMDALDGEIRKVGGQDFWSILGGLQNVLKKWQGTKATVWAAWDSIQQTFRLASYINNRHKFLAQGMPLAEARREAARRVALSFPSPNNLGPAVQNFRQGAMGVAAPFMTPVAEDARIALQLPQRLLSEPDLKWRLGISAITMAALFKIGNEMRKLQGVSDEEVDAAKAMVTRRQGTYKPVLFAGLSKDEKGRVELNDMTWTWTGWRLLQGDPLDATWRRVLSNLLVTPVEGTPYEEKLREIESAAGLIRPPPEQYRTRPGEGDFLRFLHAANKSGVLGPAVISNTYETLRQGGVVGQPARGRPGEQLLPQQMARRLIGNPVLPVTVPSRPGDPSPAMRTAVMEDIRRLREIQGLRKSAARNNPERLPALDAERQAILQRMQKRNQTLHQFQATQGAQP